MTEDKIKTLYELHSVPENVTRHMRKVKEVCELLADAAIKNGEKIDKKALLYAALLHDVLRVHDSDEKSHAKAMAEVLEGMGEKYLAKLVSKHEFFSVDRLKTLEEKILYYADKRVDRDKIVSLKKRFTESKKRNTSSRHSPKEIKEIETKIFMLEKRLAENLGKTVYSL
ncbi:MAG: HD domain-containing protein [Candidatus Peregrinibacteria bacterium]